MTVHDLPEAPSDEAPDLGRRRAAGRRRLRPAIVLVVVVALVLVGGWLLLSVRSAAAAIQREAATAQSQLGAAKSALEAGDYDRAQTLSNEAGQHVAAARELAGALPVRVGGYVPYLGAAVADLDNLVDAAGDVAEASTVAVRVYGAVSGRVDGERLFANGVVSFPLLDRTQGDAVRVVALLDAAKASLDQVRATTPGTAPMAEARDRALAQLAPIRTLMTSITRLFPLLPDAFGRDGTKRYLVAILNQAEMRASGGAPLSVAVLSFTGGRLTVPVQGQVSTEIFPGLPKIRWTHVLPEPGADPRSESRFVNANVHPDFEVAGEELARAWRAGGQQPVDGVVALDLDAIGAILGVSGPIQTPGFGTVTRKNLAQKILVDSYRDFTSAKPGQTAGPTRQSFNDQLAEAMITRLVTGDDLLGIARALGSVAPGRHFQLHLQDTELQSTAAAAGLAGSLSFGPGDRLDVYSQNGQGSKVDVFQQRTVDQLVVMQADGSAQVTRTVTVKNDTPPTLSSDYTAGYGTAWSQSGWFFYVPDGAVGIGLRTPPATGLPTPYTAPVHWSDQMGGQAMRTVGWIKPGGTVEFELSYTLPASAFPQGSYSAVMAPQPLLQDPTLHLTVRGSDGRDVPVSVDSQPPAVGFTGPVDHLLRITAAAP